MRRTVSLLAVTMTSLGVGFAFGQTQTTGVLPLPEGITSVVGLDAQNAVVVAAESDGKEPARYALIYTKHVYAGGIARLFGGSVIPTSMLASPAFNFSGGQSSTGSIGGGGSFPSLSSGTSGSLGGQQSNLSNPFGSSSGNLNSIRPGRN
ncbi:MAG: hypothetical protein HY318_17910 [Armatimonadetes bacterium]|nr:hypothetical protein [Armatimonadota bacterium]